MSPDREDDLIAAVATISADLKNSIALQDDLAVKLQEHTKADSDNFEKLSTQLGVLTDTHNQKLGAAKFRAAVWSTVTSGGIVAVYELVRTLLALHR